MHDNCLKELLSIRPVGFTQRFIIYRFAFIVPFRIIGFLIYLIKKRMVIKYLQVSRHTIFGNFEGVNWLNNQACPRTTGSGRKSRPKNFKTPFFSRYHKFLPWGNSNMSKTSPKFFSIFFSTNMVARGVQSFYILDGATDPLIEQ